MKRVDFPYSRRDGRYLGEGALSHIRATSGYAGSYQTTGLSPGKQRGPSPMLPYVETVPASHPARAGYPRQVTKPNCFTPGGRKATPPSPCLLGILLRNGGGSKGAFSF